MSRPPILELQDELKQAAADADRLEALMLSTLCVHYDVTEGDVLAFEGWDGKTKRFLVTKFELVDEIRASGDPEKFLEFPEMRIYGILVTKADRLHAKRYTTFIRSTKPFERVGRFEMIQGRWGGGSMEPPR